MCQMIAMGSLPFILFLALGSARHAACASPPRYARVRTRSSWQSPSSLVRSFLRGLVQLFLHLRRILHLADERAHLGQIGLLLVGECDVLGQLAEHAELRVF